VKVLAEMKNSLLMPVTRTFTASVGMVFNVTIFLYRFVITNTNCHLTAFLVLLHLCGLCSLTFMATIDGWSFILSHFTDCAFIFILFCNELL